jgi:HlyD family secretion protein
VYKLSGGKVPSATELDAARAEYRRAAAATRSAEAQVVQQRAALSSAETNLSRATIVSPVTGVVLSRSVDPGQTVAASFQAPVLFTIAEDLSTMRLEVKVDEADVGQVREGQAARFTVDAFPGESFPARLIRVDLGANASGGSGSATTGSAVSSNQVVAYTAVLTVDNPKLILRPGMTATARIISAEVKNTLLVPNAALRFSPERVPTAAAQGGLMSGPPRPDRDAKIGRGSRQSVYILGADGKPSRVDVVTGRSDGSWTAVSGAGLKPGIKVITGRLADAP